MAFLGTVRIVRPRINSRRFRMTVKVKNLHDAFPYGLALKHFFHGYALNMSRIRAVQVPNRLPQLLDMRHTVASTRLPIVQKSRSIPAAIAGVARRVIWRFTKL